MVRTTEGGVRTNTGGIDAGGTLLPTHPRGADGVRAPTTNYRSAAADHRPADKAIPAPAVRSYRAGTTNTDSDDRTGRSQGETRSRRNRRGATAGTGGDEPGRMAIWRGSPQFEDAVGEHLDVGSQGSPGCSPGPGRLRPEIPRLPGLFRVGSNSVERLDCSTPDGNTTQTRQLSRRTGKDAVCIQSPESSSLGPDFTTRPGGRNNRAGRPTSFYTTPGSSFWGPRVSSHRRTENAVN